MLNKQNSLCKSCLFFLSDAEVYTDNTSIDFGECTAQALPVHWYNGIKECQFYQPKSN